MMAQPEAVINGLDQSPVQCLSAPVEPASEPLQAAPGPIVIPPIPRDPITGRILPGAGLGMNVLRRAALKVTRAERLKAEYLAITGHDLVTEPPKSTLEPSQPVATTGEEQADPYRRSRLARVRKQLDRIDKLMEEEEDPRMLDKLAAAQARLCDQEWQLAGRPKLATAKPPSKARPQTTDFTPSS